MSKNYCSLGLMSGTSGDGVDASLINSDGDTGFKVENGKYYIPDIPGTGIEWNETNIEKYKVNI